MVNCPYHGIDNYCIIKKSKQYCRGEVETSLEKVESKEKIVHVYYCSLNPKTIRIGTKKEILKALPKLGISLEAFLGVSEK